MPQPDPLGMWEWTAVLEHFTLDIKSEQCAASTESQRQAPTHTHMPAHGHETRGGEGLGVSHNMHLWRLTDPAHRAEVETVETGSGRE